MFFPLSVERAFSALRVRAQNISAHGSSLRRSIMKNFACNVNVGAKINRASAEAVTA
jgi:hypothetical protein